MVDHHLNKFGDHRPCSSRDIADPIFHVALQNDVFKKPCDFMKECSSFYIPTLSDLVAIDVAVMYIS